MKTLVNIARVIVGLLFIFSGLVKANDPNGLSYKMQEFFDVWGMSSLHYISLTLAVIMIAFEMIAGAALLLGWKIKQVSWLILILIIFFTFLTGYAFLSGKFKDCGCFGDCLPITPLASFIKDVVLLLLIIFIFKNKKYIQPLFSKGVNLIMMLCISLASFAGQWYTLQYLPVVDCMPFKINGNIPQLMKVPANAVPDSTVITFEYEKNGKKVEFTADNFPADFTDDAYKFIARHDKVVKPGYNNIPPVKSFSFINDSGADVATEILNHQNVYLLFVEDVTTPISNWQSDFEALYKKASQKNIPIYIITATKPALLAAIAATGFKNVMVLEGDRTMIRTAARTNPTLYLLQKGTIIHKWSYKRFGSAIENIAQLAAQPKMVAAPAADSTVADSIIQ